MSTICIIASLHHCENVGSDGIQIRLFCLFFSFGVFLLSLGTSKFVHVLRWCSRSQSTARNLITSVTAEEWPKKKQIKLSSHAPGPPKTAIQKFNSFGMVNACSPIVVLAAWTAHPETTPFSILTLIAYCAHVRWTLFIATATRTRSLMISSTLSLFFRPV